MTALHTPAWKRRKPIECHNCGRTRPHQARNLCHPCYRATQPRIADAPTGAGVGGRGIQRGPGTVAGRRESYAELLGLGVKRADAARRAGISYRTALRYEQHMREAAAA